MAEDKKDKQPFSRASVAQKRKEALEEYEKKVDEMRKTLESVASTPEGEKFFRYLFLLCGGDTDSVRRTKENRIDTEETLLVLGAKSVYERIRFGLSSDTIAKIERHNWEQ